MQGHHVHLFSRSADRLAKVAEQQGITVSGAASGFGPVRRVTTDIHAALAGCEIIMIATTANAHADVARLIAPHLVDGQTILLNPGRTGGALEVRKTLTQAKVTARIYLAEAQSLVFACRVENPGCVRIIGIKERVPVAALPAKDTAAVIARLSLLFSCFLPAESVLVTSFENVGAMFHPAIVLLNAAAIERGTMFRFYEDISPMAANFITRVDAERRAVGQAYGISLLSAEDWVTYAYPTVGGSTLCEKMRSNPAYNNILAPTSLQSRLLEEDIPTGLIPLAEFGSLAGIPMPLTRSVVEIAQALLGRDFWTEGRRLRNLGLEGLSVAEIRTRVEC
jgi:opine dehydrogenase